MSVHLLVFVSLHLLQGSVKTMFPRGKKELVFVRGLQIVWVEIKLESKRPSGNRLWSHSQASVALPTAHQNVGLINTEQPNNVKLAEATAGKFHRGKFLHLPENTVFFYKDRLKFPRSGIFEVVTE